MPPKVAAEGHKELSGKFTSRTHENYDVNIFDNAKDAHLLKNSGMLTVKYSDFQKGLRPKFLPQLMI